MWPNTSNQHQEDCLRFVCISLKCSPWPCNLSPSIFTSGASCLSGQKTICFTMCRSAGSGFAPRSCVLSPPSEQSSTRPSCAARPHRNAWPLLWAGSSETEWLHSAISHFKTHSTVIRVIFYIVLYSFDFRKMLILNSKIQLTKRKFLVFISIDIYLSGHIILHRGLGYTSGYIREWLPVLLNRALHWKFESGWRPFTNAVNLGESAEGFSCLLENFPKNNLDSIRNRR